MSPPKRDAANPDPAQAGPDSNWTNVAAGSQHTCATHSDGTLWCWGSNLFGQLGNNTNINSTDMNPGPVQVGQDSNWIDVAAGSQHTCATRSDGTLWCWGSNYFGELGNDINTSVSNPYDNTNPDPVQVGQDSNWIDVAAGGGYTCATRSDGTLWCWGSNSVGQLGNSVNINSGDPNPGPVQVGQDSNWIDVAAGSLHTCGTRSDGTLWCWGWNNFGQLGNSTNNYPADNPNPDPVQVGSDSTWTSVSAGFGHTCGTRSDGSVSCWGSNAFGQLGNNTNNYVGNPNPDPVQVGLELGWTSVSAGSNQTCATRATGTLWCWGYNYFGELGNGTTNYTSDPNPVPVQVGLDSNWTNVTVGSSHTCATRSDGTVWCWGYNFSGQLGR